MNIAASEPTKETYIALVCVGPGEHEMERLAELAASLVRFESVGLRRLILIDDVPVARDYQTVARLLAPGRLRVLHNPRRSRGNGWFGGLAANTIFGMAAARDELGFAYVLKLDTDSLVVAPFHERLMRFFRQDVASGVVGSCYAIDLHGEPTAISTWIPSLQKWQRLLRLRRHPFPHVEQGLVGVNRQLRRLITTALAVGVPTGYRLGNCAQGGGYAVRREMLDTIHYRGWLDGSWWTRTDLGEDVVVSLLAAAAGWQVRDFNQPREVFGVQFRGLAFPPDELRARGYGIVHSLKCTDWKSEQALRDQFRTAAL